MKTQELFDLLEQSNSKALVFEYGNKRFHTCIQSVQATFQNERALILSLGEVKADCKDKEACGIIIPENATNSGGYAPEWVLLNR